MKHFKHCLVALCLFVVIGATAAYARPVGTLECTSSNGQVKFNISYFTFGLANTLNIGSQSSGAGAGKVTFQPLDVHASLSTFASLADIASAGGYFQSCALTTTFRDGSATEFDFKLVAIQSLSASASMPGHFGEASRYTDVNLIFGAVQVKTNSSQDDGGTEPDPAGWNRVQNQNQ